MNMKGVTNEDDKGIFVVLHGIKSPAIKLNG